MCSGCFHTFGLALKAEKQEIHQEATEQEEKDIQGFHLGMVDNECQYQVERHQEHDGRNEDGNLQRAQRGYLTPETGMVREGCPSYPPLSYLHGPLVSFLQYLLEYQTGPGEPPARLHGDSLRS